MTKPSSVLFVVLLTVSLCVCSQPGGAQPVTPSSPVAQKDATAVQIVIAALTALTGSTSVTTYQDAVATGNEAIAGTTFGTLPITIKTMSTNMVRLEVQMPKGKNVRILNQGQAVLFQSNGMRRDLLRENTIGERVCFFPALTLLAEYAQGNVEVSYLGSAQIGSEVTDVVGLNLVPPPNAPSPDDFRKRTQSTFYIDRNTGFVLKLSYQSAAENDRLSISTEEIVYSDYRNVNGMLVPFRQDSYTDGQPSSVLILNGVQFNVGLSVTEFDLSQVGAL